MLNGRKNLARSLENFAGALARGEPVRLKPSSRGMMAAFEKINDAMGGFMGRLYGAHNAALGVKTSAVTLVDRLCEVELEIDSLWKRF